jgi:hypothetical protein
MSSHSFTRPGGQPNPAQSGSRKARWPVGPLARWPVGPLARWPVGPWGRGLAWTAPRRPILSEARTGPAVLLSSLEYRCHITVKAEA